MTVVERDLDRALALLRQTIRERGYAHFEIQESLGLGRSYISQLLKKERSLRLGSLLEILDVVGADRLGFFTELLDPQATSSRETDHGPN